MTITDIAVRLARVERQLEAVEATVDRLGHRLAELDGLKQALADLRFEVEEMQEA